MIHKWKQNDAKNVIFRFYMCLFTPSPLIPPLCFFWYWLCVFSYMCEKGREGEKIVVNILMIKKLLFLIYEITTSMNNFNVAISYDYLWYVLTIQLASILNFCITHSFLFYTFLSIQSDFFHQILLFMTLSWAAQTFTIHFNIDIQ